MPWWDRNNLRLIQTNLRAADAALDRRRLIDTLRELSANVLLLNTGGLVAFYPTALEYHYRSPTLGGGDLTGDMVKLCNDNGIRYIARFDFSKIHESVYAEHPEWAYRSIGGNSVNYNGMVHACINSEYQRKYSLAILDEVTSRYPIDGVFFNMFGYTTRDYSNNYHGICQCGNCKALFAQRYGRTLPVEENPDDPVFQMYLQFKEETIHEVLDAVHTLIKGKSRELAISTYTDYKVDIIKKESNTEIHRPYPVWEYSASENNQSVEGSWNDKLISNVCINAIGIDYRFQGVPSVQVSRRLYQGLASGSGLDFCIIGVFADYPDRKNLPVVKKVFQFHRENEAYFGNFEAVPDIVLVKPGPHADETQIQEYLGLFKILKEDHLQFKVVEQPVFSLAHTEGARLILCADCTVTQPLLDVLEEAAKTKALMWSGTAWLKNPERRFLNLFSIAEYIGSINSRWAYLQNSPAALFPHLTETDWTMLDGPFIPVKPAAGCSAALEKLSGGRFGPPEMCGGNVPTGEYGLIINNEKKTMFYTFQPGCLYKRYGYDEHRYLISDAVRQNMLIPSLSTNAPPYIEIFLNKYLNDENHKAPPGIYNIQLINLSGFNGSAFHPCAPIHTIEISIKWDEQNSPEEITSLIGKKKLPFYFDGSLLHFTLPALDEYEALVLV
ncbi:MAG: hypothetical protein LBQ88_03490 [Treponema sp.]|jgi:hypothetical protein|nr:hypothetical protein [Treponema sp.]